jgi:hypothetical protein
LASVDEVEEAEDDPEELWRAAFADVEHDLRALAAHARAAGLGDEGAHRAIRAPVGATELSWLRGLQLRQDAAIALATRLARAGHRSAVISEWAAVDRQVRQRLA